MSIVRSVEIPVLSTVRVAFEIDTDGVSPRVLDAINERMIAAIAVLSEPIQATDTHSVSIPITVEKQDTETTEEETGDDNEDCDPEYTRIYVDTNDNREVFVAKGLGDEFGSFKAKPNGSLQRVKSVMMPMVANRKTAQINLDAYAMQHRFVEIPPIVPTADIANESIESESCVETTDVPVSVDPEPQTQDIAQNESADEHPEVTAEPRKLSEIIRAGDMFIRSKGTQPGMDHKPVVCISVDTENGKITTQGGPVSFGALDEKYRLVLDEITLRDGDTLANLKTGEVMKIANLLQDDKGNPVGVQFVDDFTGFTFAEIDRDWTMIARVPVTEKLAPIPEQEPEQQFEPVDEDQPLHMTVQCGERVKQEQSGNVFVVADINAGRDMFSLVHENGTAAFDAPAGMLDRFYTLVISESETI